MKLSISLVRKMNVIKAMINNLTSGNNPFITTKRNRYICYKWYNWQKLPLIRLLFREFSEFPERNLLKRGKNYLYSGPSDLLI